MSALATSLMSLPAASSPLPTPWVQKLFERLTSQLGAKVADLFGNVKPEKVQQEWGVGLAGYHPTEIARGLASCSDRKYAPVLGEFKQLCRPALDAEWAWHEAQAGLQARDAGELGVWSHPAVFRAAMAMSYEVRTGSFSAVRKRWERNLSLELAAGWGDEVLPPAARIEHKPTLRAIPSDARKKLADLSRKINRKAS